jgi:cytoskeletal protein RodZ
MSVSIVKITTSNQAEKLAEIGAQFKRIREDKELSIPHLTATTLISERYLRAIEDGAIDSLPEPVYVRGFIRKYGTALGAGDLSDDFPLDPVLPERKWAGSAATELRPLHLYALYVVVITGAVSLLATFLNSPDPNKINDSQTNFGNAAQIIPSKVNKSITAENILLAKAGVLEIVKQTNSSSTSSSISSEIAVPLLQNEPLSQNLLNKSQSETAFSEVNLSLNNTLQSWASSSSALQSSNAIANDGNFSFIGNKPVNVGIVMKGDSWVRIIVDGQTEFEGVLNEGKKLSWSGDRQISIRAGNASSVALSYNKQPIKSLGKEGEVAEKIFAINQASNPTNNLQANDSGFRRFVKFISNSGT